MRPTLALLLLTLSLPSSDLPAQEKKEPAAAAVQTEESFVETREIGLGFLAALPEGYEADTEKKWPLVVFLHGAGERGDNLDLVKVHGPPKLVGQGKKFPFLLISPQCPSGGWWTDQPVLELIEHIEKTHRVDPDRIYLTGLSMGGYGVWHFVSRTPEKFAAAAPICGGGVPYLMRDLKHLPVWAFHGAKDSVVPLDESVRLIEKLKAHGNQQTKLTIYPETGHNSWTESYANEELYDWLLSQKRESK